MIVPSWWCDVGVVHGCSIVMMWCWSGAWMSRNECVMLTWVICVPSWYGAMVTVFIVVPSRVCDDQVYHGCSIMMVSWLTKHAPRQHHTIRMEHTWTTSTQHQMVMEHAWVTSTARNTTMEHTVITSTAYPYDDNMNIFDITPSCHNIREPRQHITI